MNEVLMKKGTVVSFDEINNVFTGEYNYINKIEDYDGEMIKLLCDIDSNIAHLFTVYKSMGKWFCNRNVDVVYKLAEMCGVEITLYNYDDFEYYLYLGDYNLQRAKKIYLNNH